MAQKRMHLRISGRVQGVFFRHNGKKHSQKLGLHGWIKNLDDGRVEIIAEGEEGKLRELLAFCKKGPLMSRVDKVEEEWTDSKEEFDYFSIRY